MEPDRDHLGLYRLKSAKMPAWQIAVIGTIAAAIVITLAVVATGVFLLVFPAILLLDFIYRRTRRGRVRPARRSDTVIDAEYEVLPPDNRREP